MAIGCIAVVVVVVVVAAADFSSVFIVASVFSYSRRSAPRPLAGLSSSMPRFSVRKLYLLNTQLASIH